MHVKTMEGLIGARTNINMTDVPLRVYKEAERKGDLATLERAMGYVNDFEGRAYDYKDKAEEGMKEEAKEDKEKEKLEREQELEKRREERKQAQEEALAKIEENHAPTQISPETGVQTKTDNANNNNGLNVSGTDTNTQGSSEKSNKATADTVEISSAGQALLNQSNDNSQSSTSSVKPEQPVFYSSAGAAKRMAQSDTPMLNVSV